MKEGASRYNQSTECFGGKEKDGTGKANRYWVQRPLAGASVNQ